MGKSLPPKFIISSGLFVWRSLWTIMMSQLAPKDKTGAYLRPESQFRDRLQTASKYPSDAGRYQLIVGMTCPWAHRTVMVRVLKGLEAAIAINWVIPAPLEGGWQFAEPLENCHLLRDLYQFSQPNYDGRCTVPVLWDSVTKTIVNNESAEIIIILNDAFNDVAQFPKLDLYPPHLREKIDPWNDRLYHNVNNGVYRCGFSQTQGAYETAAQTLFSTLDELDELLATQRYVCGDQLTLTDIRLFTTLIRFDVVYFSLFKCDRRRIQDYPHLGAYVRDIYQQPGIAATCDLDAIRRDYYGSMFPLNPGGIIPLGQDSRYLLEPHNRAAI